MMFTYGLAKKEQKLSSIDKKFDEVRDQIADLTRIKDEMQPWYKAVNKKQVKKLDKKISGLNKELSYLASKGDRLDKEIEHDIKLQAAKEAFRKVMEQ